jgi:hypothetical protein
MTKYEKTQKQIDLLTTDARRSKGFCQRVYLAKAKRLEHKLRRLSIEQAGKEV